MKRKLKSLFLVMCMVMTMFAMTACGSSEKAAADDSAIPAEELANYEAAAESLITQVASFTDEEIQTYMEQDDEFTNITMESWLGAKEELGAYSSIISHEVEADGDIITVTSKVQYEKATADVELIIDMKAQAYTSMTFNVNYTLAQQMEQAGLNTLMGVVIVFLMLIFLSLMISLFKFISVAQDKLTKKSAPAPAVSAAPAASVEEELADDSELVAVIAAAVAAYENSSTDSFVVRSIKKSNKWRRA